MKFLNLLPSTALWALLMATATTAQPVEAPARNRTFTLTAFNTTNPAINGKPVLISPSKGIGSVQINLPSVADQEPLRAFIYKNNIYRHCSTSPTGACIGVLSKAYAGALTGWYFDFSDNETPVTLGPTPPIVGVFTVADDLEYPTPTTTSPCKPDKPTKVKVLAHGLSGELGDNTWTACDLGLPGEGATKGYSFNSVPIPTFAHNGPTCTNWGIKFKVTYTK